MKATEQMASKRALKAMEIADNLRREVDMERESGIALKAQVGVLSKRLEDAKSLRLATVKLYAGTLEQFGGSTPPLPSESLAFSLLSWMKANFMKLPDFVYGAVDFGALASTMNFVKMLAQDDCPHVNVVRERDLGGLADLRTTSREVWKSVRHFMKSF